MSANKNLIHEYKSDTGTVEVYKTKDGIRIDSYYGDVKDKDNHDRFSIDTSTGRAFGHDRKHENSFDTSKNKEKTKK